jgi:hypothetical protein
LGIYYATIGILNGLSGVEETQQQFNTKVEALSRSFLHAEMKDPTSAVGSVKEDGTWNLATVKG